MKIHDIAELVADAPKFQEIPPAPVAALRVAKIDGPFNPARSPYAYDRSWIVTFENGKRVSLPDDRVSHMCHAKVGGYYVFNGRDVLWFYSEEDFKAKYRPI